MINAEWKWINQKQSLSGSGMKMQCPTNKQLWKMDATSWRSTGDMRTSNIQTMKASLPKPDLVSSPLSLYSGNPILTVLLFHEYPKVPMDLNDIL